jgi:hypothetical protein
MPAFRSVKAAREIPLREFPGLPFRPARRPCARVRCLELPEDKRLTDLTNRPLTPPSPLSHEIADAAGELACRIELGEFDDLDEEQMAELRTLATLMAYWATHAQAMEERLVPRPGDAADARRPGIAQCN